MIKKIFNFNKKLSLDYVFILSIFASFIILVSLILGYITYNNLLKSRMEKYITESNRAAETLSEAFNNVEKILHTVAKKIEINNIIKLEEIEQIFKKIANSPRMNQDIFAWTMFDFVSPEGYVLVDSIRGVVKNPIKIINNRRSWLESSRNRPGELHFSSPDIGIVSGEEIIPTGYGVFDHEENFIGTISIGLSLKKLNQKLANIITSKDLEFLIIDNNLKEQSKSKYVQNLSDIIKNHPLSNKPLPQESLISPPIIINGVKYNYISNVKFSPYYILIGENNNNFNKDFYKAIFPQVQMLLSLSCFYILMMYFFKKRVIKPVEKISEVANSFSTITKHSSNSVLSSSNLYHLSENMQFALTNLKDNQLQLNDLKVEFDELNIAFEKLQSNKKFAIEALNYLFKILISRAIHNSDYLNIYYRSTKINKNFDESLLENNKIINDINLFMSDFISAAINKNTEEVIKDYTQISTSIKKSLTFIESYFKNTKIDFIQSLDLPLLYCDSKKFEQIILSVLIFLLKDQNEAQITINTFTNQDLYIEITIDKSPINLHKLSYQEPNFNSYFKNFLYNFAKKFIKINQGTIIHSKINLVKEKVEISFPSEYLLYAK